MTTNQINLVAGNADQYHHGDRANETLVERLPVASKG